MLKVGRLLSRIITEFFTNIYLLFWYCLYIVIYSDFSTVILIGIVNPIEAKVRKGKGAVGAYGNERTQQSLQDFPVVDSEEEEEKVHLKQYQLFNFVAKCAFWSQSALLPLGNKMYLFIFVGISERVGSVA